MAVDYVRLVGVATRLIVENGRPFSLLPPPAPAVAAEPWAAQSPAAAVVGLTGVFAGSLKQDSEVPTSAERKAHTVYLDTSVILSADVGAGWALLDGALRFEVLACEAIKPGGMLLLYILTVRA